MINVKRMDEIKPIEPLADKLTEIYERAFGEINKYAAQRHLLTAQECRDIWADPRIQKWIAFDDNDPVGVAVITNDLAAWPLISPQYFERIEPERYAARTIFYIGFVGVAHGYNLFAPIIAAMAPQVMDPGGMAVMDFAHHSIVTRSIDRATGRLLKRLAGDRTNAVCEHLDSQHFYAWTFIPEPQG